MEKIKRNGPTMKKKEILKSKTSKKPMNLNEEEKGHKAKEKKNIKNIFKAIILHINRYRKIYGIILAILLIVLIIFTGYILIRNYSLNRKYGKYEKKMEDYGFSLMYDNKKADTSDKITRLEMLKVILSAVLNTTKIENVGFGSQGVFDGDQWSFTAEAFGVIDSGYINKDNYNDNVTYWEIMETYLKAREKLGHIPVSYNTESNFKNLPSFTTQQKQYVNDLVENKLISNSKKRININNDAFKGQLNEIIVNSVEKYNNIVPEGETIVTKDESKPSNQAKYPYILYSVNKEVYEYKGIHEGEPEYQSPVEIYKYKKDSYDQVVYRSEQYYNTVLNIDYNTINEAIFKENINLFSRYPSTDDQIKDYVDYVKQNQIQIKGTAKVQLPIFYLDGIRYRARIKVEFDIINSNTDTNLLFADLDRDQAVKYNKKNYTIYIDAPMGTTLLSLAIRLDTTPIIDMLVGNTENKLNEI